MKLISAKYHNFIGFGETDNVLNFDDAFADGETLLMVGIRDGDPQHSNGAGKSTIVEGICYGFFGRLPRIVAQHPEQEGKVAVEIIRTDDDNKLVVGECYVEIKFRARDDKVWRLKRGRKVNKKGTNHTRILELERDEKDGEKHTGADAEKKIGEILSFSFEALVNSCLFAQRDSGKFLSGTDSAKKDLFMELVGTQIVDRMLVNVRKRKSVLNGERTQIDARIAVLKNRLMNTSQRDPETEKLGLEKDIEKLDSDIAFMEERISEMSGDSLREEYEALFNEAAKMRKDLDAEIHGERDAEVAPLTEQHEKLIKIVDQTKTDLQYIEQAKTRLQTEYNELEVKISSDEKLAEMERFVNQAKKNAAEREQRFRELTAERSTKSGELAKLDTKIEAADQIKKSIEKFLETGEPGTPCPTCGSQWTKDGAESEIAKQKAVLDELIPQKNELMKGLQLLQGTISNVETNLDEARKGVAREADFIRIKSESDAAKARCEQIKVEAEDVKKRDDQKREEQKEAQDARAALSLEMGKIHERYLKRSEEGFAAIEAKEKERDAALVAMKEAQEKLDSSRKVLDNVRRDKSESEKKLAAVNARLEESKKDHDELRTATAEVADVNKRLNRILVLEDVMSKDGFKTQVARKYVPHMDRYANEFLSLLSPDLALDISMDGNEIKVVVQGASASTYDMCSGGEQEAIRLAVNIANSMIAIGGDSDLPGIILLDEIFGSLDPMVRKNVFVLLERLSDYFPRIVVITHDLGLQIGFAKRLVVAKDGKIARIAGIQKIA